MKFVLALTVLVTSGAKAHVATPVAQNHRVVYEQDNRQEVYEASVANRLLARSTAAKIYRSNLNEITSGSFQLGSLTLGQRENMCADERFLEQPVDAECTGFLVGPDLLVTAGHCVDDQSECDSTHWVFDYQLESGRSTLASVPSSNVFNCRKVIRSANEDGNIKADYALVQLDRVAEGRAPLRFRTEGQLPSDARLTLIGNGARLPTKVVTGSQVVMNDHAEFFSSDSDSFEGNSGSPVINESTLEVEGIMVRGAEDYVFDNERMCSRVNRCPPEGCNPEYGQRGEESTRITLIPELRQQQKVLNAARAGNLTEIRSYLDNDGWIDIYDNQRQSMVFRAVQGKQLAVLSELISRQADVNLLDISGETPLHAAVRAESVAAVEALLAAGARADIRNARGQRAIDLCRWHSVKQRRIRQVLQRYIQNNG